MLDLLVSLRAPALVLLAAVAMPLSAAGQAPSYVLTRDACNGMPVTRCITQNDLPPLSLWSSSSPSDYAFAVYNNQPVPIQVLGFELWTSSITGVAETVSSHVYEDVVGPTATIPTVPAATPLTSGSITVGGYNAWWSTSVYPPALIQPGQAFWVGMFASSRIAPPINQNAATAGATFHRRANVNNNAWLPYTANGAPALRIRCADPSLAVPHLSSPDLPRLGQPFRLSAATGLPFTPAFVVWAFSGTNWSGLPTPWNLAGMGAVDCYVHTSMDFSMFLLTDGAGVATQNAAIPNAPGLVGVTFFNQAALFSTVNALGFVTTNMGRGAIGP